MQPVHLSSRDLPPPRPLVCKTCSSQGVLSLRIALGFYAYSQKKLSISKLILYAVVLVSSIGFFFFTCIAHFFELVQCDLRTSLLYGSSPWAPCLQNLFIKRCSVRGGVKHPRQTPQILFKKKIDFCLACTPPPFFNFHVA